MTILKGGLVAEKEMKVRRYYTLQPVVIHILRCGECDKPVLYRLFLTAPSQLDVFCARNGCKTWNMVEVLLPLDST